MNKKDNIVLFEVFGGIGSQYIALKQAQKERSKNESEIEESVYRAGTIEWNPYALVFADFVAEQLENDRLINKIKNDKLSKEEIDFLKDKQFSTNSKSINSQAVNKFNNWMLNRLIETLVNNQAFLDIYETKGSQVENNIKKVVEDIKVKDKKYENTFNSILTYSFPCQSLSNANFKENKGIMSTDSQSSVVWEVMRILNEMNDKPDFLLLENVSQLKTKYGSEYRILKNSLSHLKYKTFDIVSNSQEHGALQSRKRLFAISVFNENGLWDNIEEEQINELFQDILNRNKSNKQDIKQVIDFGNNKFKYENSQAIMKDTKTRRKMVEQGVVLDKDSTKTRTVTTKQDRFPNTASVKVEQNNPDYLDYRLLTPRECFKLMGWDTYKDFDKVFNYFVSVPDNKQKLAFNYPNSILYQLAGNAIELRTLKNVMSLILELKDYKERKLEEREENKIVWSV
ncbi:DNA cytosine methyltransferase [Mycoplasma sp. 392]